MIAVRTPIINTANEGCARSTGGFAFSQSESMPEVVEPGRPGTGEAATRALFGATVLHANARRGSSVPICPIRAFVSRIGFQGPGCAAVDS